MFEIKNLCHYNCYRKSELLTDLRQYQQKVKEIKNDLEKTEIAELKAKGEAHDAQLALEASENTMREKSAHFKVSTNALQGEIKLLKSK